MSPFLTAFVAGVLGGIASGVVLGVALALFGRRIAERVVDRQIAQLEARFKENLLDVMLGKIASFLDQGERISQIVKRVVEIAQLLFRHGTVQPAAVPDAATLQVLRDLANPAPKPEPAATSAS